MEKIVRSKKPEWFDNPKLLRNTTISELGKKKEKVVTLAVTVKGRTVHYTDKGKKVLIATIEDDSDSIELPLYNYENENYFKIGKELAIDLHLKNSKYNKVEYKWQIGGTSYLREVFVDALLRELYKMTNKHCSYTGQLLTNLNYENIDQFIPKKNTDKEIFEDNWENLFIVDNQTKQIKGNKYDDLLLKPDADDYDFDKYFEIYFESGNILPKTNLNDKDKKRAEITINVFGLNDEHLVRNRRGELKGFLKILLKRMDELDEIDVKKLINKYKETKRELNIESDTYSFRFYLKRFLEKFRYIENKHLKSISIKNYFCIQDFEIENIQDKKEIYFLGENGDGKTIVLQAILLAAKALSYNFLFKYLDEQYANNFSIKIQDKDGNNYKFDSILTSIHTNIYAFGVGRFYNGKEPDELGYLSLFSPETELTHPIEWFKEVQRLELLKKSKIKLKTVVSMFEDILENKVKIDETEVGDFVFKEKGAELKFNQLSDGYRSVLIWLSDLLSRLTKNNPEVKKLADFKAVVLVDEIGCFLHPKWEYTIVRKLRKMFPKIQWIFTTHSPIVTLGASKDAVFYKLYKEEGITKVSEPFNMKTYANRMLSSFVTSPLFDLPTARPAAFEGNGEDLETGDYIYTLIHKEVRKRLKDKPLQDGEIKKMVSDLIDKYEKVGKI